MALTKKHNHDYSAGIPQATGDRYYAQDLGRDFNYLLDQIGLILYDQIGLSKSINSGWIPNTSGASTDCINISAGIGYAPYDVTVPSTPFTIPPSTATETMSLIRVFSSLINNFSLITSGATGNGSTTNYLKIKFAYSNNDQRARAKKGGTYYYNQTPSYTITCNATPPTSKEICLADIVWNSSTHSITITYTDRTESVFSCGNNILLSPSGGDDGAIINNYINLFSSMGSGKIRLLKGNYSIQTYINMKSGVSIEGNGNSTILKGGSGLSQVILIDSSVSNYTLSNFDIDGQNNVYSNSGLYCTDNTTNLKTKYLNLNIYNIQSNANASGIKNCVNLINCSSMATTTNYGSAGSIDGVGFDSCINLTNCYGDGRGGSDGSINSGSGIGFLNCYDLSNCIGTATGGATGSGGVGDAIGFKGCVSINGCQVKNLNAATYILSGGIGKCYGFYSCSYMSSNNVSFISNVVSPGAGNKSAESHGYYLCTFLSSCNAINQSGPATGSSNSGATYGFNACTGVSNCNSNVVAGTVVSGTRGIAYGYLSCHKMANNIGAGTGTTPQGYKSCFVDNGSVVSMTWSGGVAGDTTTYNWNTGTAAA